MATEFVEHVAVDQVRYAQCWEDAQVLLDALDIRPGHVCVSIASAGDNTLAMLSQAPARVIALDVSAAQLACLELRVGAYRLLEYEQMLELLGHRPSRRRVALYKQCRASLSAAARRFWDARGAQIAAGVANSGRMECYLAFFRRFVLPLAHSRRRVQRLLELADPNERREFFQCEWDSRRWRALTGAFFSRLVLGRLGRDPAMMRYVRGPVAARLRHRLAHALITLDPRANPYLQWILTGRFMTALPYALRPEQFEPIRANLDRLEWHRCTLEALPERLGTTRVDRFNLSDVFEYMSPEHYSDTLRRLAVTGRAGTRMAYWNLLVARRRPPELSGLIRSREDISAPLHVRDQTFFYRDFVVEELRC